MRRSRAKSTEKQDDVQEAIRALQERLSELTAYQKGLKSYMDKLGHSVELLKHSLKTAGKTSDEAMKLAGFASNSVKEIAQKLESEKPPEDVLEPADVHGMLLQHVDDVLDEELKHVERRLNEKVVMQIADQLGKVETTLQEALARRRDDLVMLSADATLAAVATPKAVCSFSPRARDVAKPALVPLCPVEMEVPILDAMLKTPVEKLRDCMIRLHI